MSLVAIRVDRCKASQGVIVDAGSWQRCSPVSAKLTQLRGGLGEKVESCSVISSICRRWRCCVFVADNIDSLATKTRKASDRLRKRERGTGAEASQGHRRGFGSNRASS
jgi:hypothetical protein